MGFDRMDAPSGYVLPQRSATYLHARIISALRQYLRRVPPATDLHKKPLTVDLVEPLPLKLRFYAYLATTHPSERSAGDYRIQVILPNHRDGRQRFDRSGNAVPVLIGYVPDLDVHVLWDADVHDYAGAVPYSKGVQVHAATIYRAVAEGMVEQFRRTRAGGNAGETVVAARRSLLVQALLRRQELSLQSLLDRVR
jgi:hypothetical protein